MREGRTAGLARAGARNPSQDGSRRWFESLVKG